MARQPSTAIVAPRYVGEQIIEISEKWTDPDPRQAALTLAAQNGLIDLHTLAEHERQLNLSRSNSGYSESWNEDDWDRYQANPTQEVRAEIAQSKWDEFVHLDYARYREAKAAEWEESSRRMESLAKLGKGIAWVPVAIGGMFTAAEVIGAAALSTPSFATATTATTAVGGAGGGVVLANELQEAAPVVAESVPGIETAAPAIETAAPAIETAAPAIETAPALPTLSPASGGQMLGEAIGRLKVMPEAARVDAFRQFAQQITSVTNGQWSASEGTARNGTIFAGELGEALVFDSGGAMFRGNIGNLAAFPFGEGGHIEIVFSLLKPIK